MMNTIELRKVLHRKVKNALSPKYQKIIKNSFIYDIYEKSVLNWRYPLFSLNWKIARYLTRPRKVEIDNIEFTIPCENWITHFRWYLFKIKEPEVRRYIKDNILDKDVFFDIGANIGVFSVYAAKLHKNISVYCFEPEYSNVHLLKNNILANNIDKQVSIFSIGISNETGLSKLHLSDNAPGAAVHTESQNNIKMTDEGYRVIGKEGIMTITLDEFCEKSGIVPNCLKIDTDGNELKILTGAVKILKHSEFRSMIIEMPLHNELQTVECEKILIESGLRPTWSNRKETKNEIWGKKEIEVASNQSKLL